MKRLFSPYPFVLLLTAVISYCLGRYNTHVLYGLIMLFVVFLGSYFLTRLYRNKALKKLTHDLNSPLAVLHVLTEENQQPINHDGKHLLRQATQQIKRLIEE